MRNLKRFGALALAVIMAAGLMTTALIAANKNWVTTELGALSQYYETGNSADPGYVSTVSGDSGGTSYGIYMFIEKTVTAFMDWLRSQPEGSTYRSIGDKLYNAYAYRSDGSYYPGFGSNFRSAWQEIGASNTTEFTQAQTDYWEENCYTALLNNIQSLFPAFDMNDYSVALQNVFWSRSVQHGVGVTSGANSSDGKSGATGIIYRAFTNQLGGFKMQSEAELIDAIYKECSKLDEEGKYDSGNMETLTASKYGVKGRSMTYFSANSGGVQTAVYSRLHVNEPSDALVMRYSNTSSSVAEGKYRLLCNSNQSLALVVNGSGAVSADAGKGTVLTLTAYHSGKYTLTAADGTRLTDSKGTVKLAAAAADKSQFWTIENGKLKNVGSDRYLTTDPATNGTYAVSADVSTVSSWYLSPLSGADGWTMTGLFYPGCTDSDGLGSEITHALTEGNASFPLRGIISHPKGISSVVVTVKGSNGGGFTASAKADSTWFDLWELDKSAAFSKLTEGKYTLTISATSRTGGSDTLVSTAFTVGARDVSTPVDGSSDTYTVTFVNGSTQTTRTYTLGETYGELPEVTTEGFKGWFLADGTEIASNSIVAAENHTVTAQFGELHSVTFVSDGVTLKTSHLAKGSLITAPATPVKAADSNYVYSFRYWKSDSGDRFVSGATFMGESNVTYTAVFSKSAVSSGSSGDGSGGSSGEAPTPSGSYLTGITPGTSVASLTDAGYTVYDGSTPVTSGLVGTGMTASNGATTVTVVVTGDVSGDGKITITDVVKLQSSVTGVSSLSGAYAEAGDINGDGKITITDVVQAAQVTVGQRSIG